MLENFALCRLPQQSFINFYSSHRSIFCRIFDYKEFSQQQGSILELSPEDLNWFRTMQKADKELQAALKLSRKRGKNSDGED